VAGVRRAAYEVECGHRQGGNRVETFTVSNSFRREIDLASDEDRAAGVPRCGTMPCGEHNNDRLSNPWPVVISLADGSTSI
jgi:hypothetical protein